MTTALAVTALIISVASFVFNIYQYRINHGARIAEKASALQRFAQDIRRKSEDLKHKFGSTDDVGDYPEHFEKLNVFVEEHITKLIMSKKISLRELTDLERGLLPLELEIDLMHKQVTEAARFNDEVRVYKAAKGNDL